MMKRIDSFAAGAYVSPRCKMHLISASRICSSSPYGDDGKAGGEITSDNTHEYDDDL